MLHQKDEKEMTLEELSFPNHSEAYVCKGALRSAMFTPKYRGATGTLEASHSGWFHALTRLGGSQSSRGTTAPFRGILRRSATTGHADDVLAPSG